MTNFNAKKVLCAALITFSIFSSCNQSPYPGYEATETGLYYKFHSQDEKGPKPNVGDYVVIRMVYKNDKDSVIFDSQKNSRDGSGTLQFPLAESTFKGSFEEALMMMSPTDSASFKINADSLYLKVFRAKELPKGITSGSMLTFEVKLDKIKNKEELMEEQKVMMELRKSEEAKTIAKYIADNNITAQPTATGLFYIEKVKGKGKQVVAGDTVMVNYKGMFMDGNMFDTSERAGKPVEFPIGVGAVIKGWDEGIPMMNVGGKAMLLIPSSIAYGEMGAGQTIPPFSPLLFEVEVVGVK